MGVADIRIFYAIPQFGDFRNKTFEDGSWLSRIVSGDISGSKGLITWGVFSPG